MAGEILAVGQNVKGWKLGDRVCANFSWDHIYGDIPPVIQASSLGGRQHGVLTEYKVFSSHSLVRIPNHLSYEDASTLPCPALTAYNCLLGSRPLEGGDTVLIQGTGGVSIFALQFAVASGAIGIVISSSDEKLKFAETLGAKHLINYYKTSDWDEEVMAITNGHGVDYILDIGNLAKSFNVAHVGGGIVNVIGVIAQKEGDDWSRGIQVGSVAQFEDMIRLISAHNGNPIVDKVYPFEKAVQAYAHLLSQAHVGKVVTKVSEI